MPALFPLGRIVIGDVAWKYLCRKTLAKAIKRHASGDWGPIARRSKRRNDRALKNGEELNSAYWDRTNKHIWISTKADRSQTTISWIKGDRQL